MHSSDKLDAKRVKLLAPILCLWAVAMAGPAQGQVDADVQEAYDTYVKEQMPGVGVEMLQAAKEEGTVLVYTPTSAFNNAVIEAFQERFPFVHPELVQISDGALLQRWSAEQEAGAHLADVLLSSSERTVHAAAEKGWCDSYTPTVDAAYPDSAKLPGLVYRHSAITLVITFRPEEMSEEDLAAVRSWETLGDPRWSGMRFGWIDPQAGGSAVFAEVVLYKLYGTKLWEDHVANVDSVAITGGGSQTVDAVLRGEVDLSGPIGSSNPYEALSKGAPVGFSIPSPTIVSPSVGCISQDSPHPNAAHFLWEFILSNDGQEVMFPYSGVTFKSDLTPSTPEIYADKPWFHPADMSTIVQITQDEVSALTDTAKAEWDRIFKAQ